MSDRDSWCTPRPITRRLPLVDLDPCSNRRSTVKARRAIMLERGENGLLIPWTGKSVFVNPPFSDVLPWAEKVVEADSFCFLVNVDPSTKWWKVLTAWGRHVLLFRDRIAFDAPPGVESSQNDRAQCLICDDAIRASLADRFSPMGLWWRRE